ncbi:MAG: poly-beta-1,6 N-acetyl-D-glucosamine export porin PgaA [Rhodoferax sp.]|nr:poly-beta-1,6 N-acetyl-D-glucosamine export porin PgaA [Rhodoferax sp.]
MNLSPTLLARACAAACLLACLAAQAQSGPTAADSLRAGQQAAQAGDFFAALRAFATARQQDPQNRDAVRAVADMLVELGAPFGAAQALGAPLDAGLRSRMAASRVRWGQQIAHTDPTLRYADTDRAIAELQALLSEARAQQPADTGLITRLLRDLAVALRDRRRWSEVLQTTQALRAQSSAIPAYVRQAEADALLALRRPADARSAYAEVLAADPLNREAYMGRLYAELEDEDLYAALASADALLVGSEPARRFGKDGTLEANADWLDAQIAAGQVRGYVDLPEQAWERLLPLAEAAPALPYLRAALGGVAAQRGWPRRSAEEIAIAHSLAPEDLGMQLGQVESDIRLRQWHRAQAQLRTLAAQYPDEPGITRAQRDLDNYHAPELRLEMGLTGENGGGIHAPGAGSDSSLTFYTPPLAKRWRIAAAYSHSHATLPEGAFTRERTGLGLEGRWPDVTLEAFGWENRNVLSTSGSSLQARWEPDDHWSLQAASERVAADTPLRAMVYGITANLLSLGGSYRWDETRTLDLSLRSLAFSDGNQRQESSAALTQQVLARPGLKVAVGGSLYASKSSQAGGPYFNPSSDSAVNLTLGIDHLLWRSYEHSWQQHLTLGVGSYSQAGFASAGTASARYEQEYQQSPFCSLRLGLDWASRVYDGVPEQSLRAYFSWEHRIR